MDKLNEKYLKYTSDYQEQQKSVVDEVLRIASEYIHDKISFVK